MICVSIGRSRHRHMIAEHRHLCEQGAKLVELRLDYLRGEVSVKRLLENRPSPVVITCRRDRDGGRFVGSEGQRQILLRAAIAEGAEYVDLEHDVAGEIGRFGPTKRIVSLHDFQRTPADLDEIHRRLSSLDADVVKICALANHPQDNLRMLELTRKSEVPMVGLCMGDMGVPTRILAGRFGAPFSYATFHHERAMAPGQLSFDEMKESYNYENIDASTEVYGVVADPVGHSLSPLIHNAAFRKMEMNKVYIPIRVPREDLVEFMDHAPRLGVHGLSVTIPHKESVIESLTQADGAVRGIGAANTVVFDGDQRAGYNTDYRAAMDSLQAAVGWPEGAEAPLQGRSALVLGAGGVGRAIAYGLLRRGAKVVFSDGDSQRAVDLAERLECRAVEWSARHGFEPDLIFNCTPIGMHPNVDESPFSRHYLRPNMIVFDAVYNPENTLLVKEARQRACKVVTGVDMFVRQAALQFKLFTDEDGPTDLMREVLKRATAAVKY